MVKWHISRYTRTAWFSLHSQKHDFRGFFILVCACFVTYTYFVLMFMSKQSRRLQFIQVNFLRVELWRRRFLSNKLEFFISCNNIKLQEHPSFCIVFWCVLFYKKVIVLHRGDYNFLFWHLCQIHTFNNNLNDEEMITYHIYHNFYMIKMLQLSC